MGGIGHAFSHVFGGAWQGIKNKTLGHTDTPAPSPDVPAAPTVDNSYMALDEAALEQAKKSQRGRASTILSGSNGVSADAPTASARLLGNS